MTKENYGTAKTIILKWLVKNIFYNTAIKRNEFLTTTFLRKNDKNNKQMNFESKLVLLCLSYILNK